MDTVNIFATAKGHYENEFKNMERFQDRNEKILKSYFANATHANQKLDKNCREWINDSRKALNDYRDLILKGLDYLDENLKKSGNGPEA